ncbi:MAG TPA: DUF6188 family protein [Candidatus Saccharimonadales bacterium]|nr:DUF6188 family protein [Candidatus Saccharimonadales bacterium]
MAESTTWRTWDLNGLNITQLRFDYQFHIDIWSLQRGILISFGVPFLMRLSSGQEQAYDPENSESLGPLLNLVHKPIEAFMASSEGQCVLLLKDGTQLKCEAHEKYEAWETHGSGELESASLLCPIGKGSPWG